LASSSSLSAFFAVTYAEAHPQRLETLTLASPAGVPDEDANAAAEEGGQTMAQRLESMPWGVRKTAITLAAGLWRSGATPQAVVRNLPSFVGNAFIDGYVTRRFPEDMLGKPEFTEYMYRHFQVRDGKHRKKLLSVMCTAFYVLTFTRLLSLFISLSLFLYLFLSCFLLRGVQGEASGDYALPSLLHPPAIAKIPLCHRLLALDRRIPLHLIYGDHRRDWMDPRQGAQVKKNIDKAEQDHKRSTKGGSGSGGAGSSGGGKGGGGGGDSAGRKIRRVVEMSAMPRGVGHQLYLEAPGPFSDAVRLGCRPRHELQSAHTRGLPAELR
jgi:pimeloyl-ACP methyl ester carboxylesterase